MHDFPLAGVGGDSSDLTFHLFFSLTRAHTHTQSKGGREGGHKSMYATYSSLSQQALPAIEHS